jgi:hypothetical protein
MSARRHVSMLACTIALSGCTLLLDPPRHEHGGASAHDASVHDAGTPREDDDAGSVPSVDAALDARRADEPDSASDAGPPCDQDEDGHLSPACGGDDCDDRDDRVYPLAPPICGNDRVESCPSEGQSELLALLDAEELGVLPRRVVVHDTDIAPEVVTAVSASPLTPNGSAFVAYRERTADRYVLGVVSVDLATHEVTPLPHLADGLFARALGAGDLGGVDDGLVYLGAVTTTPDWEEQQGTWLSGSAGSLGSSAVGLPIDARRGIALVGTDGAPTSIAFASDGQLVRYTIRDGHIDIAGVADAPFGVPVVRGDGAGPYAHFRGTGNVVWDLTEKACVTPDDCGGRACGANGVCAPRDPLAMRLDDALTGEVDLAYASGILWYVAPMGATPGVVHVGTVDCGGAECVASSDGILVMSTLYAFRPQVEPLAADALAIVGVAATGSGSGYALRVAFHQPSSGRQVSPHEGADEGLDLASIGEVQDLRTSRSTYDDPRTGRMTTLFVTAAQPSSGESIVSTGLRVCERL